MIWNMIWLIIIDQTTKRWHDSFPTILQNKVHLFHSQFYKKDFISMWYVIKSVYKSGCNWLLCFKMMFLFFEILYEVEVRGPMSSGFLGGRFGVRCRDTFCGSAGRNVYCEISGLWEWGGADTRKLKTRPWPKIPSPETVWSRGTVIEHCLYFIS